MNLFRKNRAAGIYLILIFFFFISSGCENEKKRMPRKRPEKSALSVMRTNDCFVCHGIQDYLGVPSYNMIARRYEGTVQQVRMLKNKVLEGGGGNWGSGQMVKHPYLKEKDAEKIVRWVLSLDSSRILKKYTLDTTSFIDEEGGMFSFRGFSKTGIFEGRTDIIDFTSTNFDSVVVDIKLQINRRGKYFFFLPGSGISTLSRDNRSMISDNAADREIMLDLDTGVINLTAKFIRAKPIDTLALFWLPTGKEHYELLKKED